MKPLKVLVSASGAPGCSTLIRMLKNINERKIFVVAVDMDKDVIGRFFADQFYQVPPAKSEEYIPQLLKIVEREDIDVFYVVSSAEILTVAENISKFEKFGCVVTASDPDAIRLSENKYLLYQKLQEVNGVPVPDFYYPKTLEEFVEYVKLLGYPQKRVCFKPHISKGSRGFRILDANINRKDLLLNYKPSSTFMSLEEFIDIFRNEAFPTLILMEVVDGPNYDVMCLADKGVNLLTTVKTREAERWGVIVKGELIDDPHLHKVCSKIVSTVGLSYNFGLQFINDKIIEINSRPSTFIYQENLNEPYLAIKLALGEISHEEIRKCQDNVCYGRRMIRYMDQIFY